jgi:hypothetical protein
MKYLKLSNKLNLSNTFWSDDFYLIKYTLSFQILILKTFITKFVWLYMRLCLCNPLIFLTYFTLYLCIIIIIFYYSFFLILFLFLIFFLFIKALIAKLLQWIISLLSWLRFLFTIILNTKIFIIKIKVKSSFLFFNDIFKVSFFSFV